MPLIKCSLNGKSGWKYGNAGHCYTGPGAKKKAVKQGLAENGGKWSDAAIAELATTSELITAEELADMLTEDGMGPMYVAMAIASFKNNTGK